MAMDMERVDDLERRVLALEERTRRSLWTQEAALASKEEELLGRYGEYVDKINLFDFEDYDYLVKYGDTDYQLKEGANLTESNAKVNSGYLEMSNVQTVTEMVNMISITRAYETNQKIMQTMDNTLDIAVNQLGRLQ